MVAMVVAAEVTTAAAMTTTTMSKSLNRYDVQNREHIFCPVYFVPMCHVYHFHRCFVVQFPNCLYGTHLFCLLAGMGDGYWPYNAIESIDTHIHMPRAHHT